ncbi:MAG TPA: succinylglutamate desuccinylase/aspartoacylase family protein [Devosiaceae bacterium]|jgi:hypothetical protein
MVKAINLIKKKFTVHADGSDANLFIHELIGESDGPTIGVTGCVHGDENTGSQAILDLYRILKDLPIKGRILLLPVVNARAFAANKRNTPVDALNLNREFPGDAKGTFTQQLAVAYTKEFLDQLDIHIDLHSGTDRPTVDYTYIWNDEELSRAFGTKVLYRPEPGKAGTVYAGTSKVVTMDKRDVKVVTVELGGGIVDQTPYTKRVVDGILNILRVRGVIPGEVRPNPKQVVVTELVGIRPTKGGWVEPLSPANGELIKGDQLLGRVVSPYTFEVLEEIPAPFPNGIMVMQHLTRNLVEPGDYGWMVGNIEGSSD